MHDTDADLRDGCDNGSPTQRAFDSDEALGGVGMLATARCAETRVKAQELGGKIELVERDEPEQKQPKTIITEIYLDALWMRILGLARAGIEKVQDKPSAAESAVLQTYDYV